MTSFKCISNCNLTCTLEASDMTLIMGTLEKAHTLFLKADYKQYLRLYPSE